MNRSPGAHLPNGNLPSLDAMQARLAALDSSRLAEGVASLVEHLGSLLVKLRPSPDEFAAIIDFLTVTGHHADARRQEWVLLADALGISGAVHDLAHPRIAGVTPSTPGDPFYRADTPAIALGESICRDGQGEPMTVSGTIRSVTGQVIGGAIVEVWHANAQGYYENQEPDRQPEHNLRGRMIADERGNFRFLSIKPAGYSLPADGPVGQLLDRLGLSLRRPAHINLRVTAPGFRTLTTQIFDRDDPAIDRDAIFGTRPELLANFRITSEKNGARSHALEIDLVLAPASPAKAMPARSSK